MEYWEIYKKFHLAESRLEPWSVVDQVVRWRSGIVIAQVITQDDFLRGLCDVL